MLKTATRRCHSRSHLTKADPNQLCYSPARVRRMRLLRLAGGRGAGHPVCGRRSTSAVRQPSPRRRSSRITPRPGERSSGTTRRKPTTGSRAARTGRFSRTREASSTSGPPAVFSNMTASPGACILTPTRTTVRSLGMDCGRPHLRRRGRRPRLPPDQRQGRNRVRVSAGQDSGREPRLRGRVAPVRRARRRVFPDAGRALPLGQRIVSRVEADRAHLQPRAVSPTTRSTSARPAVRCRP